MNLDYLGENLKEEVGREGNNSIIITNLYVGYYSKCFTCVHQFHPHSDSIKLYYSSVNVVEETEV